MTLVTDKLRDLAGTLADLKDRVRVALAGELARAVADAVRDVVQTVFRREPDGHRVPVYPTAPTWQDPADPWAEDRDAWAEAAGRPWTSQSATPVDRERSKIDRTESTVAAAAGLAVSRWWLQRRGNLGWAVGLGALVTAVGLFGGPVGRVALATIAAAADLLVIPDLLGSATDRLSPL
jgi:hypothetical protein